MSKSQRNTTSQCPNISSQKKKWKGFVLCFLSVVFLVVPVSLHATGIYPQKLGDFSTFEGFRDVYSRVYDDTHREDLVEILRRVREHDLEHVSADLDFQALDTLRDLDVDSDVRNKEISTLRSQILASFETQNIFNTEKKLLRFQNQLARRNAFRSMFSNDSLPDSPFDLMQDLHEIDSLFFGQKYRDQRSDPPSFATYDPTFTDYRLIPEDWQDQRIETLEKRLGDRFTNPDFFTHGPLPFVSITEALVMTNEVFSFLLKYPTIAAKSTRYHFEFPLHQAPTSPQGLGAFPYQVASPDKTPVVLKPLDTGLSGLEDNVLRESNVVELGSSGGKNSREDLSVFGRGEHIRKAELEQKLIQRMNQEEMSAEKAHFGLEGENFLLASLRGLNTNLQVFLWSFYYQEAECKVSEMHNMGIRQLLECFNRHEQK